MRWNSAKRSSLTSPGSWALLASRSMPCPTRTGVLGMTRITGTSTSRQALMAATGIPSAMETSTRGLPARTQAASVGERPRTTSRMTLGLTPRTMYSACDATSSLCSAAAQPT